MPRRAKGPRLHWREKPGQDPYWEIRDTGDVRLSTGTASRPEAETALETYLQRKRRGGGPVAAEDMNISEALTIYAEEHPGRAAAPKRIGYAMDALDPFWGKMNVGDVSRATCYWYTKNRKAANSTIRRELNVLQAAINHCFKEAYILTPKNVHMPAHGPSRTRWLTRQDAGWLLRGARALNSDGRHLQDFILHGLYTGSRKETILAMHINHSSPVGGRVDTINDALYRKPSGKTETGKRQTTSRIPPRYLSYLRSQASAGRIYVVERQLRQDDRLEQSMVADIRKGWT